MCFRVDARKSSRVRSPCARAPALAPPAGCCAGRGAAVPRRRAVDMRRPFVRACHAHNCGQFILVDIDWGYLPVQRSSSSPSLVALVIVIVVSSSRHRRKRAVGMSPVYAGESVNVSMQNATENCGDFHLFVDPADNTPYVIAGCGFHMWIERLMPNMLDSAGDTSPTGRHLFDEYFIEAPALFFRGGAYYAIFASCCCYCFQGSGAIVHTAPHPLGPWTTLGDVACIPAPPSAPALAAPRAAEAGADGVSHGSARPSGLVCARRDADARPGLPAHRPFDDVGAAQPAVRYFCGRPRGRRQGLDMGRRPVAAITGWPQSARPAAVGAYGLQRRWLCRAAALRRQFFAAYCLIRMPRLSSSPPIPLFNHGASPLLHSIPSPRLTRAPCPSTGRLRRRRREAPATTSPRCARLRAAA